MEASECGLVCLAMLGAFHGLGRTLTELRSEMSASRKGTTLDDLIRMAEHLGMQLIPVSLDLDGLPELTVPCILHWDMDHFVVLRRLTRRGALIHDPAVGVREVTRRDLELHFTGVAAMCKPTSQFASSRPSPVPRMNRWLNPVRGSARSVATILGATIGLELLTIAMPLLLQWIVDEAQSTGRVRLIDGLLISLMLLVIISATLDAARGWLITLFGTRLNLHWAKNIFAHLLRLPMAYFERRDIGSIATSFASVSTIQRMLTHRFISAVVDGLMAVGTFVMLVVISFQGAWIALGVLSLYIAVRLLLLRRLRRATVEQIAHSARQQSHFLESVRGMQSLRLYGQAGQRQHEWERLIAREMDAATYLEGLEVTHGGLQRLLFGLQRVVLVGLTTHAVMAGQTSLGTMFAFLAYIDLFVQRSAGLIDCAFELTVLKLHVDRVGDIVQTPVETPDPPLLLPSLNDDRPLAISARGLTFSYAFSEPDTVHRVDLDVAAGECVALAGPSGCGKTTLVKLLLGLHTPKEGEIRVNGLALSQFGRDRLRTMVGTVMQDDVLFAGSLAQNISLFDTAASAAWIEQCARMASVHDDIMAMPTGYGTLVGESGTGLSGGQKQRILLARALYRRPQLLVLDEATSHLDLGNENRIIEAVSRLNITRILVAHRPQTLAMADRIITLVGGNVVSSNDRYLDRVMSECA